MRDLYLLNNYRIISPEAQVLFGEACGDDTCGAFFIPSPVDKKPLKVVATIVLDSEGRPLWDHVSVSRKNRCPNWAEMCEAKRFFFMPEDCVIQYHPPQSQYVNLHETCLHLWRHYRPIEMPPMEKV